MPKAAWSWPTDFTQVNHQINGVLVSRALRLLENLAARLEREHPGAAASLREGLAETLTVTVSERGATRMDDRTSEASMERRKKEGYF